MTDSTTVTNVKKGPILAVIILGAFVSLLNQTLMNVALPSIMEDLEIGESTAQWITTGFMLVNGVLIPITAFLMEKFSTRQLFITAISLFAVGTLICGVAPGFTILMTGRVIQAIGAGIIMPLLTTVVLALFPVEKRGGAMGIIGIAIIFAPAVGPTLSGFVVQNYSWRVLFYIIFPIAVLTIILAVIFLKNVTKQTFPDIDILAIVLSTLGFGGILYGFSIAGTKGWGSAEVITGLIVGFVGLLLFVWRELRVDTPMLDFRVFKSGIFSLTTVINIMLTVAMFAPMLLIPIYLQNILDITPMNSGLMLMPGAIVMGIMSPITGKIFDKIGARPLAIFGLAITVVTTYLFTDLTDSTSYMYLIIIYTIRMFGMSMIMMPIMTAGLNQLPQRLHPHGTAMVNTVRAVAGAIGTAFLVTVMTTQAKDSVKDIIVSNGFDPTNKQEMLHAANMAQVQGINDAFMVSTVFAVLALILSFFIKRGRTTQEEEPDFAAERG
ncbi:DHA2 family efflux MFS transporter permease subunit [Virgibacillus dakarensis]|uniref:MFS-type transporter YcnB n=1 Tax=Lentibacillus populi TaxID=1827502 RepID=A0A9W5TXC6_9BACI|nr:MULTISPECIES: DHA2 family efflux MFS transporter permease subunit [Bacillaceae]MBT2218272.1 DHA2 family efflux MFS transporter permease subunit [Virgibacillus dakarensis]MTW84473.1 DHA2 family efflux MFS transporter permease subunit [Virgibacillus dakarensis]GGB42658.1 putative MFS-type transporter YcnB [Lentibacillus populi]